MVLHTAHRCLNVARRCDSRLCNPHVVCVNLEHAHRSPHRSGKVMMKRHRKRRSPLAAAPSLGFSVAAADAALATSYPLVLHTYSASLRDMLLPPQDRMLSRYRSIPMSESRRR